MNDKASKGVKINLWVISIFCLMLLGDKSIITIIWAIACMFCCTQAIRLRREQWSRKAIILLAILGILSVFTPKSPMINKSGIENRIISSTKYIKKYEMKYDTIPNDHKIKLGMSKNEYVKYSLQMISHVSYTAMVALQVVFVLYMFFLTWFFTRPKVKEQFK
jgi:hypothetical protein